MKTNKNSRLRLRETGERRIRKQRPQGRKSSVKDRARQREANTERLKLAKPTIGFPSAL